MKVVIYNIYEKTTSEYEVQISDETTIQDLMDITGCGLPTFPDYYPFCHYSVLDDVWIPFIINSNNELQFEVPYKNVTVKEFIGTHRINNDTIRMVTGYPQAGGIELEYWLEMWNYVYPYIEQVQVAVTVGIGLKRVIDVIKKKFIEKKQPPQASFDIIYTSSQWDLNELASLLELEKSEAEILLKGFGFEYDSETGFYKAIKNEAEVKSALMQCIEDHSKRY